MRAIVNFSDAKYMASQIRLAASVVQNFDVFPYFPFTYDQINCEHHSQNMYAFKPYAIKKLLEMGYNQILWLDASMIVVKDLEPIFQLIETQGYFFQDSGWINSRWTNRNAKEYFGTDDGEMISSGVLGINFESSIGQEFFRQWMQAADDGIFNGSHKDHRHDQTCASIIAHKLGMTITPNNTYWNYGKEPWHENILIIADGIS